jgi:hypothetical protein
MSKCKPATKAEIKWCERLERVLKAHPKKLWIFAGDGSLSVLKKPEDGEVHTDSGSVDYDNSIYHYDTETIHADGGGY